MYLGFSKHKSYFFFLVYTRGDITHEIPELLGAKLQKKRNMQNLLI